MPEQHSALHFMFEYGKWIIAQLFVAHAGALVLIARSGQPELYTAASQVFLVGLVLSLLCGVCAWLNFYTASFYDRDRLVQRGTTWIVFAMGLGSIGALWAGGMIALVWTVPAQDRC